MMGMVQALDSEDIQTCACVLQMVKMVEVGDTVVG